MTLREEKWHYRMRRVAKEISNWSKDRDRKVGCVITTADHHILATGYNGYPRGIDIIEYSKLMKVIHAEVNAILRLGVPHNTPGLHMYVYGGHPCSNCAGIIIQRNIDVLYCDPIDISSSWVESMQLAKKMFIDAMISYNIFQ